MNDKTRFLLFCSEICTSIQILSLFLRYIRYESKDTLRVIARNEAIQKTNHSLDCFVVPPRNDTKPYK